MNQDPNAQIQTEADDIKQMEIEETEIKMTESKQHSKRRMKPGRGNAICGYKDDYDLYEASDVFDRVM